MKRLLTSWRNYSSILAVGLLVFALSTTALAQQSGVSINQNGSPPHESAGLDVDFDNKGFLPPRMTTAERDAIVNPAHGLQIFNTTTDCINYRVGTNWLEICGTIPPGSIASLDCSGATLNGVLAEGVLASGVSAEVAYTGGNSGPHNGQTVSSIGVTGLTAELTSGNFASGAATLIYNITGTPSSEGTASFSIEIGGETCVLEVTVGPPPFMCGTSTVTFMYNGSTVTYGSIENTTTGECWLDRNLGASQVATSSTSASSYGDLFQWGRPDDGHQERTSSTTNALSPTDQPTHGNFITTWTDPHDWRDDNNDNRWNATPIVNNPCPSGWRLPTEAEWLAERNSWSSFDAAGAFASLKLTYGGHRTRTGSLSNVQTNGRYWSSTINGDQARIQRFRSSDANTLNAQRVEGHAVRCIRD